MIYLSSPSNEPLAWRCEPCANDPERHCLWAEGSKGSHLNLVGLSTFDLARLGEIIRDYLNAQAGHVPQTTAQERLERYASVLPRDCSGGPLTEGLEEPVKPQVPLSVERAQMAVRGLYPLSE